MITLHELMDKYHVSYEAIKGLTAQQADCMLNAVKAAIEAGGVFGEDDDEDLPKTDDNPRNNKRNRNGAGPSK